MNRTFDTPEPIELVVEIQSGDITLTAAPTRETTVAVGGAGADAVRVEQDGRTVSVLGPRPDGLFRRTPSVTVAVTAPERSRLRLRTGSADATAEGRFGGVDAKSGSGDLSFDVVSEPSILVTGSGDLRVERADAPLETVSGSGDVVIGTAAEGLRVKMGSGDVVVGSARGGVSASTGSGDIRIRSLAAGEARLRTGTGDAWVGVPGGLPVWTDILAHGGVTSALEARGEPAEGEPFVAIRAQVGTGSVHLEQA